MTAMENVRMRIGSANNSLSCGPADLNLAAYSHACFPTIDTRLNSRVLRHRIECYRELTAHK